MRVVVTSRETLIDKADIPVGSIVLKLLEFDERQRAEWIKIWNKNNEEVYRKEQINPFMLPENNSSIDELSRQPLLLIMLAIYDANLEERTNSLGREENLNRTKLYNELLKRFIRRELRKGPRGKEVSYEESAEKDKEIMVDLEMKKLGIAALGMFIRGKLSLKVYEMERDLNYMESQTPSYENVGKMLSNAEEFFGTMVLEWLLCVNNYLEKVSYPLRRYGDAAVELLERVLHRYPENIQILSEMFKCCRKMEDTERGRSIFRRVLKEVIYDNPRLLIESPDLFEYVLTIEESEMIVGLLKRLLDRLPFRSWDLKVGILKNFIY